MTAHVKNYCLWDHLYERMFVALQRADEILMYIVERAVNVRLVIRTGSQNCISCKIQFSVSLYRSVILEPNSYCCGIYALCFSGDNLSQTQ